MTEEEKKRRANCRRVARIQIKACKEVVIACASIKDPEQYGEGFARHVRDAFKAADSALWYAQGELIANGGKL